MARIVVTTSWAFVGLTLLGGIQSARAQYLPRAQAVSLRVWMPQADAELLIDDEPTKQAGTERHFISPPLDPCRTYTYTLTATWDKNSYTTISRTRKVMVQAGREVEVDLRQADAKEPDKYLILFVPTPDEVVAAMCKLGAVGKDDVVYDLGCGDGRMVITAVKQFGARRGVGVDIDPERIQESKENATKAGVTDRVEFRQGDVLNIKDLADASVILLYMGEDVNLRLRPILQRTLKPGSRIISHQFLMGDWKPLQSMTVVDTEGISYDIHLWKVGENGGRQKEQP